MEHKPFLQIHVVEHCNLNCRGCAHFSPIAPIKEITIEDLISSYECIRPYFSELFCRLELMGGEPLLHSHINEVLKVSREYFKDDEIRLVTNGLKLLNMSDEFFETCLYKKINIAISVYPIGLDYSEISKKLEKYKINYKFYGNYSDCKRFIGYRLDMDADNDISDSYSRCKYSGHCIQLRSNRLYPCFVPAYVDHLNDFFGLDIRCVDDDYVSLSDKPSIETIKKKINGPIPFCRYCDISNRQEFLWGISTKNPNEWIENYN
jgi:hypothetical protein